MDQQIELKWFTATKDYQMGYNSLDNHRKTTKQLINYQIMLWLLINHLLNKLPSDIINIILKKYCRTYKLEVFCPGIILIDKGSEYNLMIAHQNENDLTIGNRKMEVCIIHSYKKNIFGICFEKISSSIAAELINSKISKKKSIMMKDCILPSVTHLTLDKYFNQSIFNLIPPSVTNLYITSSYEKSICTHMPSTVQKITFTLEGHHENPIPFANFRLIIHENI